MKSPQANWQTSSRAQPPWLRADGWPEPLPAEPVGRNVQGMALLWPQGLQQVHQPQGFSKGSFPWQCVLGHKQENVSSSAELQQQEKPPGARPQLSAVV